jgi:hypothetical protein
LKYAVLTSQHLKNFCASTLLEELANGVDAHQLHPIPAATILNSGSVLAHGEIFTDNLANWIRKGFVAGPFHIPPCKDFRSNSMLAVTQKDKVRVIMDLSNPEGECFNDDVDINSVEKVHMATAKEFGYAVVDCGHGARMWKFVMRDASKIYPLNSTAVAAFDRLGNTVLTIVSTMTGIPRRMVFRTLDDVPIVTPASSSVGPHFTATYKDVCHKLNISLAENCPSLEKAFEDSMIGTLLGIQFDTKKLTWTVSALKRECLLHDIVPALHGAEVCLLDMQHIMGILHDFAQRCPFLKAFRQPLNAFLARLIKNPHLNIRLPTQARKDLRIWAAVIADSASPLPIPHRPRPPSFSALNFVTDTASASYVQVRRRRVPSERPGIRGAAAIGICQSGAVWLCARVTWPTHLLLHARDEKDRAYGCKSRIV